MGIFSLIFKVLLNYIFIGGLKLGISGLIISKNLEEIAACLFLYILAK